MLNCARTACPRETDRLTLPRGESARCRDGRRAAADRHVLAGELVSATFDALDRGAIEVYIPEYFKEFVTGKANDVEGFVAGTAQYMSQQQASGRE